MEKLDQEKFNTAKELADMGVNLSLARAEFKDLKDNTEKYLVNREKEAEERVIKVFKKSREALEETTKNHDQLSSLNRELKAYAIEMKGLATDIATLFEDFNNRMTEADSDMKEFFLKVSDIVREIKLGRSEIEIKKKLLEGERLDIAKDRRLLKDRQEMLKRGFEELKKLKDKKI